VVIDAIHANFPKIIKMLGDKKFLIGNNETFVDFYFLELIKQMSWLYPEIYSTYPTLKPYVDRV
jgi:glutathione S-transferase